MKHEGKQSQSLGLRRQQLGHKTAQEHRFLGEIAAGHIGPARVGPAFREGGVDRVQHSAEPAGKLLALRDGKGNPRLPDLGLGPHEPLAHSRGRDEKRRGDRRCVYPQNRL